MQATRFSVPLNYASSAEALAFLRVSAAVSPREVMACWGQLSGLWFAWAVGQSACVEVNEDFAKNFADKPATYTLETRAGWAGDRCTPGT